MCGKGDALEPALVVTIALLVLLGGTVTVLSRQRVLPWSLPAIRAFGGSGRMSASADALDSADTRPRSANAIAESLPVAPMVTAGTSIVGLPSRPVGERSELPELMRVGVVPDPFEALTARLDRFEERLDAIARTLERQGADLTAELRLARSELALRADADENRRDAAMERLRSDVLAALSVMAADRDPRTSARRPEVTSELYARLARLEAALTAVTNPILLPGEVYAPPEEFPPGALVWENWNEVGERAFALADAYSAQRLHLSEQTRADLGGFVTSLRTLLTRSVYPNLQPEPDVAQQATLRGALEEIATELPKVRGTLELEYWDGRPV